MTLKNGVPSSTHPSPSLRNRFVTSSAWSRRHVWSTSQMRFRLDGGFVRSEDVSGSVGTSLLNISPSSVVEDVTASFASDDVPSNVIDRNFIRFSSITSHCFAPMSGSRFIVSDQNFPLCDSRFAAITRAEEKIVVSRSMPCNSCAE